MGLMLLGIMAASLVVAAWRLFRGWRSAADPMIVAITLGVLGGAGALIDGDWSQALGQATALALAGTSALWAGKPRDRLVEKFAIVTPAQRRLLQAALILRIAAVTAGLIVFVLWVAETGSVYVRSLATFAVAVMIATSAILEHSGGPRIYLRRTRLGYPHSPDGRRRHRPIARPL